VSPFVRSIALAIATVAPACAPSSATEHDDLPFAGDYDTFDSYERCTTPAQRGPLINGFGATAEITATADGYTLELPSVDCPLHGTVDDDTLELPPQDCGIERDIQGSVRVVDEDTLDADLESTEEWPPSVGWPDGAVWSCTHTYTLLRAL
jgi:hypothetical protein